VRNAVICAISLIAVLFVWTDVSFAGPSIKEGLWEISSKMEMEGMPSAMPITSYKKCLTKKDLVPQKEEKGQECKVKSKNVQGNTVTWDMDCTGQGGKMNSKGKVTYEGTVMHGTMHITVEGQPPITNKVIGKRIGPCK
jgi:hypothetical protein